MSAGNAERDDIAGTLRALEKRHRDSLVKRDFSALETLVADDLVCTHSTGVVQNRASYLQYIAGPLAFLSIERGELTIQVFGDTAQMTGKMISILQPPKPAAPVTVEAQVLQVWVKAARGWQMTAFQATRLPLQQP